MHTTPDIARAAPDNQLLCTLMSSCREGVIVTDAAGLIVMVNQAFTAITGYEPAEVMGKKPRVLSSDRHPPEFFEAMGRTLRTTGCWEGEIWNRHKSGEAYPEWLRITVMRGANGAPSGHMAVFQDLRDIKRHQDIIFQQAHHDALTGLPGRHLFMDRLSMALRRTGLSASTSLAVICLDMDRFRLVNDSLGHLAGDMVLTEVAARLSRHMRQADTLSRYGGDCFYILLRYLKDPGDAAYVAGRILTSLAEPLRAGGQEFHLSASLGITIAPSDSESPEQLMQNAEMAMFRAKEAGRNTYHFFTEELGGRVIASLRLENDLRKALAKGEFVLHYQPLVDIRSGRVTGMEALVRWVGRDGKTVPPLAFIPLAEEIGLIGQLGRFVLAQACLAAGEWNRAGFGPLKLAVNLSTKQFEQRTLAGQVFDVLNQTGLAPELLELEVTESVFLSNFDNASAVLGQLRQAGVSVALDDFGTGYSCLAYLKRLPITTLKLDKSFVDGLPGDREDTAIVSSVLSLAHNLGLSVVAEGVETKDQHQALVNLGHRGGCQGYLFSKPLPEQEFSRLLRHRNWPYPFGALP